MKSLYIPPIYTTKTRCQDCYRCIRECPVKAIKVENTHAVVMHEQCIFCGKCVEVCPAGAKSTRNDIGRVKQFINSSKKVYLSLAPSYISEFSEYSKNDIVHTLLKLGFDGISETALGAEKICDELYDEINKTDQKVIISSCCPTVVEYIQKYYPEKTSLLSDLMSPLEAHCNMLRKIYGDDIITIFAGPCISKKIESDEKNTSINAVLTFEELKEWMKNEGISFEKTDKEYDFIPYNAKSGNLFPIDGGMIKNVKQNASATDKEFMSISGIKNISDLLSNMKDFKTENTVFIEAMACEGGCINGPKTQRKRSILNKRFDIISKTNSEEKSTKFDKFDIKRSINIKSIKEKEYTEKQICEALKKIGKFSDKDMLNCEGCGYGTCREFAISMLNGKSEPSMCVSYMKKKANNKANAILKTMPSGLLITDNKLNIIEYNNNFLSIIFDNNEIEKLSHSLEGYNLKHFPHIKKIFKSAIFNNEKYLNRTVKINNSIYSITIFEIEKNTLIGGIFQDITMPSVKKEQIIKKAREVISKNLETVQKIAYLLGENAADTEMTLDSIISSFSPEDIVDERD